MAKKISSVADLPALTEYPDFNLETRRLAIIREQLDQAERDLSATNGKSSVDAAARVLLDGDGDNIEVADVGPSPEQQARELHHKISVLRRAEELQTERIRAKRALIVKNDIIPRLAPLARERAQAVARALHQLAAAMQAEHDFRDDVDRAGYAVALAALPDAGSKGPLGRAGNPNDPDSPVDYWIRELLDAGLWPTDCTLTGHYWSGHVQAKKLGVVGKSA